MAFSLMGRNALLGVPNHLPRCTGASRAAVLGEIVAAGPGLAACAQRRRPPRQTFDRESVVRGFEFELPAAFGSSRCRDA